MGDKGRHSKRPANPTPLPTIEQRRAAVTERLEYWRGLSPTAQLADLDRRLGVGVGAVRQRARLMEAR
jgi:hypothetical protein